jgi:putative redox protein
MEVQAKLLTKMSFAIETGSGYHMILDTDDPTSGQAAGPCPTELLLAALAGCMGMSLTSILGKMKQQVTSYDIHIIGEKSQSPPHIFTSITLEHLLSGTLEPSAIQRAMTLAENRYCLVGLMLRETVKITNTFQIKE